MGNASHQDRPSGHSPNRHCTPALRTLTSGPPLWTHPLPKTTGKFVFFSFSFSKNYGVNLSESKKRTYRNVATRQEAHAVLELPIPNKAGKDFLDGKGHFKIDTDQDAWKLLVDNNQPFSKDKPV